ncbi:all-trans retinoic acid-induced differentiation factor isoform X1 [Mauremys reevesii]|uniref:all-trans retinoic acid-induced differentiation factor isoform X1 n=1 Tax=Mauremys reevesii TaxID=260615 RepID=UPI00194004DC|nr:all-trans retinoic acid-induced differentiation factor isoform X1 [Mauremys reevesii]
MGRPVAGGPGPRAWVLRLLLGLAAWRGGAAGPSAVCSCCPGPVRNGSSVASYCAARPALELQGRCCLSREPEPELGVIVGLDLGNCSLTLLCAGFPDANTAVVIDLTENPLGNIPNTSFQGFTRLQSISLPRALECPGGNMAWDLNTTHGDSRTCQGQRNFCNSSGELAWLCPENSQCSPDGPGLVQCLCSGSYHGYKCLREGTFPLLLFYGILGAVTTTLSLLAWGSQRRKAKAS